MVKNPTFLTLQETSLNFPVKSKALRAGSHCGGGERKAQALISFGVDRKRENVPYFLAIRGDVWWAGNGANKDVFFCKTEPFFSKGIMIK